MYEIHVSNPGDISISATSEEVMASGVEPHLRVTVVPLMLMPVGPNQAMGLPMGAVSFNLDKERAVKMFREGLEAAEALPDPKPHIDTATSLSAVDAAAERLSSITRRA